MGVLNITPDSFYKNNQFLNNLNNISDKDLSYADIVDIGAESSRPFSKPINVADEIRRLSNIDFSLFEKQKLSIDSYKYDVIKYALDRGFNIINDITAGGKDNRNFNLAVKYKVPIILMHMQGNPQTMQKNPKYHNILDTLMDFFDKKINIAVKKGIDLDNIIIDPGIGFGKTIEDNFKIINNLKRLKSFNVKLLIGISRKSLLQVDYDKPEDRLQTSLSTLALAVYNGADIVRVHDVYDTYKVLNIIDRIKNQL